MPGPFTTIKSNPYGIGYGVYYDYDWMVRNPEIKTLAIDGVAATQENLKNRKYSYTLKVYAAIRPDLHKTSMAYKLLEILSTENTKRTIDEKRIGCFHLKLHRKQVCSIRKS